MKIRIKRGIYGFRSNGNVVEKTSSSAPFEVTDEEGERLISLRVAEKVKPEIAVTETTDEEFPDDEVDMIDRMGNISKQSLKGMSKEDLIKFAEALGIDKSGNKKDLEERLKQCTVWAEDAELQEEEGDPDLFPEDPE